ncbi:MAG: hypothetical protein HQ488_00240 [Parcubacteria group bacterium]|nr:hypothetical protein [Parcubacteria group bacterium]
MNKSTLNLILLSILLVAGIGYGVFLSNDDFFEGEVPVDSEEDVDSNMIQYDEELGLTFSYQSGEDGYLLIEPPNSTQEHEELVKAFILMKTSEYKELQGAEGGEGPPTMNVTVFKPTERHVAFWLENNFGYTGYEGEREPFVVDGVTGLSYETDGLYRGKTVAVLYGDFLYLFTASYHEQDDGRLDAFTEFLATVQFDGSHEVAVKDDLIRLFYPEENASVASPLALRGEARGNWFFEATFPVVLTDWDGLIIAQGHATALDEWMTESYVPFEASLEFDAPGVYDRGSLILHKSNASGLPEHDNALEITVRFSESPAGK